MKLKTAGCLGYGERVFICGAIEGLKMPINKDYEVTANVLFSNSHDGSAAVRAGYTPIVPICSNTLAAAHGSEYSKLVKINHGSSVNENVNDIFEILNDAEQLFNATFEQYQKLLDKNINQKDVEQYVIKTMEWEKEPKEDWSTRRSNQYDKIVDLIKNAPGSVSFQGTLFSAYNGLNTYLNHESGRNAATKAHSIWFGKNRTTDNKALANALEMAG
jgi:phage/plasmid-like protein (TIGR03299 family)